LQNNECGSSIRTKAGTIIRSIKSRYWTNDWDSMYRFIKEHERIRPVGKETSSDTHERVSSANPDLLPDGLERRERVAPSVVRRSKGKTEMSNIALLNQDLPDFLQTAGVSELYKTTSLVALALNESSPKTESSARLWAVKRWARSRATWMLSL
jgi:hypothetical protein